MVTINSKSQRRVTKRLPGGAYVIRSSKKGPKAAKCSKCGVELKGISRMSPIDAKKAGVSKKRVSRPFGGNLCSKCSREIFKKEARV